MKTAEFLIASAGFINAMFTDSAPSVVICGSMFWVAFKKLMKQFGTANEKCREKREWNWQECTIPKRQ